jgi:hypothetical protein
MKSFVLALLMAPLFSFSQTLALLDRKLLAPIQLSDSLALSEVQSNYFPVYLQDLDSVVQVLEDYRRWIDQGQQFPGPREKVIGHSSFFTDMYTFGPRERYRIVFNTGNSEYRTSMVLVHKDLSTRQALQNLAELIDYLRNNLAVVRDSRPGHTPNP